jgi:hypothetical protein
MLLPPVIFWANGTNYRALHYVDHFTSSALLSPPPSHPNVLTSTLLSTLNLSSSEWNWITVRLILRQLLREVESVCAEQCLPSQDLAYESGKGWVRWRGGTTLCLHSLLNSLWRAKTSLLLVICKAVSPEPNHSDGCERNWRFNFGNRNFYKDNFNCSVASKCLFSDSRWFLAWLILRPWRWRRHNTPKRQLLSMDYTALYPRR